MNKKDFLKKYDGEVTQEQIDKKEAILKQIDSFDTIEYNDDQKRVMKEMINLLHPKEADMIFHILKARRSVGFGFDYSPEIANGRLITLEDNIDKGINVSSEVEKDENKLIIGDNFNALKALNITHKNKVDVIYIDPPYNTESAKKDGNQSSKEGKANNFIYKDKFGRTAWLNMMKQRLELSKDLLTDEGIIFVSIDDNEQAYLKVLMDEIFGEQNCIAAIIVQKKSGGGQAKGYYKGHDHLFAYAKDINKKRNFFIPTDKSIYRSIEKNGEHFWYTPDSIRKMHGKFQKDKLKEGELVHRNVFLEDYKISFKTPKQKEIEEKLKTREYITVPFKKLGANMIVRRINSNDLGEFKQLAYSIITAWTTEGQNILDSILLKSRGEKGWFDSPKPVTLIKSITKHNLPKNGTILDFFAGSGTTAQAILELNKEDGGNRKFILCTNNENNIAYDITIERLQRIITGKGSNGETDFPWIEKNKPYTGTKLRVLEINTDNDISITADDDIDEIVGRAVNGLYLLNSEYNKCKGFGIYHDLAAMCPLSKKEEK